MTPVNEVWDLLRQQVAARETVEVSLASACGGILRESVFAPEDQPAFDRSAVDGFIVRVEDASAEFRVVDEIRAGDWNRRELARGEAMRIATGAAVPGRAYEVIMLEDATEASGLIRFGRRGRSHVRLRGEDVRAGECLVPEGTMLGEGSIGLLAGAGCTRVRITRELKVLHIATGNEIVPPEAQPGPGQIRDANSALVAAWARRGGLSLRQQRVGEDPGGLDAAISGQRDLLLISGGASVGGHDHTGDVLAAAGFELLVTKVNARPGKPLIVARRGDDWAFGLPGNPLSHFVCLHVFVAAAAAAMLGAEPRPLLRRGTVLHDCPGNLRETWWPAREGADGLRPLAWTSSGDLTALARADALVRVPALSGLAAGEAVEFIRT
jgi:molybdopterin molybdotransferase